MTTDSYFFELYPEYAGVFESDTISFKNRLLSVYNIEIPIFEWKGRNLLRLSFNAYNDEKDADRLIDAIKALI